jgi:hypothetical protein
MRQLPANNGNAADGARAPPLTSTPECALVVTVVACIIGTSLAHEIGHRPDRADAGQRSGSPPQRLVGIPGDLMNRGIDLSFENRSGCSPNGGVVSTPITDSVSLLPGIGAINVPAATAQAQIDANRYHPYSGKK